MVFLGNLSFVAQNKYRVGFIHNNPLDPKDGMMMPQSQLEQIGVLVDSIPEPQPPAGKVVSGMFVDPSTKTVFYEYSDPPVSVEQQISDLKNQNAQMLLALVQGGLM